MPRQSDSSADSARELGISDEHFTVVESDTEKFFKSLADDLIEGKVEELRGRRGSPGSKIPLRDSEIDVFAVHYCEIVRLSAGRLARLLGQAVGFRQGFRGDERRIIERIGKNFVMEKTSREAALKLLAKLVEAGEFQEMEQVQATVIRRLDEFAESTLWMRYLAEELRRAIALYGEGQGLRPGTTSADKVADPDKYPTLSVKEAMELFDVSRSTIYRWLDEGLLQRAPLSEGRPKRTVRILTESAARLLMEKPDLKKTPD